MHNDNCKTVVGKEKRRIVIGEGECWGVGGTTSGRQRVQ